MECLANMHKYKNMSMVVYMHIFVCVHGLISLSHILTPSKVNTIFKHSWHTIQKLFQMWIYSLELEFHPLHTQSVSFIHSFTRSFIHWRWAPSFFRVFLVQEIVQKHLSERLLESNVAYSWKYSYSKVFFSVPCCRPYTVYVCLCMYSNATQWFVCCACTMRNIQD